MLDEVAKGDLSARDNQCKATERCKERRGQKEKNLLELVRRRWNDGEFAEEDPISPDNVQERKKTSGVEGEADG
jgi:hypothetical protein